LAESYNKGKSKTPAGHCRGLDGKLRLWADETSSIRDLHFAVGSGLCSIYRSYDTLYMLAQYWPLRVVQHDDRDCVNLQILLVPDIFVGSDQYIESSVHGGL
jgi:hypothetical protein